MFLVLITVFTLVIGPLNFFILNRRKQLYLLLVTVPVLAALTSVSLFVYAMLSDGLNVKARLRSLTLLDQKNHEAVSVSRGGFYAGLAPTAGLKFSPETLVLPIWPGVETPAPSDIDWSNGQHFASSWLRSRTPTQFVFRSNRVERGRLEISTIPGRSEELQVANGFSWDIGEIVVCDQSKTLFFGQDLRAGSTTVLHAASAVELTKFGNKISAPLSINSSSASIAWNRPEETRRSVPRPSLGPFGHPIEAAIATNYSDSQAERFLKSLREGFQAPEEKRNFPQHFYVATCLQPPALDFGLPSVTEISSLHVLYGRY